MSEASKSPFYEQSRQMTIKLNEIHEGQWGDWDEIDRQTICAALESAHAQGRREGVLFAVKQAGIGAQLWEAGMKDREAAALLEFQSWLEKRAQQAQEGGAGDGSHIANK